tara:strand:+ start:1527 stop:2492 length:966 start_codon:yes stop_codon:yes gene_type:complete
MPNYDESFVENSLRALQEEQSQTIDENTELVMNRIDEYLAQYQGEDKVVTSHEIHEQLKKKPLPPPVTTFHPKLDDILGGFYPGQHILIGAQPKSGKSEFILDLVRRTKDHNPLLLAFEQDAEELITIMMERGLEVPLFSTPRLNKTQSIKWITERITESVIKFGTRVVFLDHFGYIKPDKHHAGGYDMLIVDLLQQLKKIAKSLQITIVTAVHTTKMSPLEVPTSDNLKGSAGFRQEADAIIVLWREAYMEGKELIKTNKTLVSIQENRRKGTTGSFRMKMVDYKFIEDEHILFHYESDNPDEDEEENRRFKKFAKGGNS